MCGRVRPSQLHPSPSQSHSVQDYAAPPALPQTFFACPKQVVPELIGCMLVKRQPSGELMLISVDSELPEDASVAVSSISIMNWSGMSTVTLVAGIFGFLFSFQLPLLPQVITYFPSSKFYRYPHNVPTVTSGPLNVNNCFAYRQALLPAHRLIKISKSSYRDFSSF